MMNHDQVKKQYGDGGNLSRRISIHDQYSENSQGFYPWLFSHYKIAEGDSILELGAGTGMLWQGRADALPPRVSLTLTDFSPGMVEEIRARYAGNDSVRAEAVNAQDIPYPDHSFDIVIANHMLYHVPDIDKALAEIVRVLKPGGLFYASTIGEAHLREILLWLHEIGISGEVFDSSRFPFTLQNGGDILRRYFGSVQRDDYPDALDIPDAAALGGYIRSFSGLEDFRSNLDGLEAFLETKKKDGILHITKESGLFMAEKAR